MFVNGFHETWPIIHAEDAYGLARVGQTIVNVPDCPVIELYVDDEPLFIPTARTPEYLRVLDMRTGVLTRDLLWATPSGKHVRVRSTRLVSFEHRHVMAISYEVDVDRAAPVVRPLAGRSTGRTPAARAAEGAVNDPRIARRLVAGCSSRPMVERVGDRLVLGYQTVESGMTLGVAVDHVARRAERSQVSVARRPGRLGVRASPSMRTPMCRCGSSSTPRTRPLAASPRRSWSRDVSARSTG